MALVSRSRFSSIARSSGGNASRFPGPGLAFSFFRVCSAGTVVGALTSGESVLVTRGSEEPVVGGARPAPTQPAVRRIKKSATMRVAGASKEAPRDREEQGNALHPTPDGG